MRPLIAIPMGDAAGIGPEITVKTIASPQAQKYARMVVVGDRQVLEQACEFSSVTLNINVIESLSEFIDSPDVVNLIQRGNIDFSTLRLGEIQGQCGKAAYDCIEQVIMMAMAREVDAVATTPINKESLKAGKVDFIGHTEIFGKLTGTADPLTMFQVRDLRVFFLSRHLSLVNAIRSLTPEKVCDYAVRSAGALNRLGLAQPRLTVAAINPHGGEHGLFGTEDDDILLPGIEMARARGINISGPKPADSVFHFALQGEYDAVLSPYHDQGHIATKMVDFHRTISITNGMPILRTSVDHGTANDIAGRGVADPVSMIEAVRLAARYAPCFVR
ncbi:4-hydroxythreonine-4-phosphate dehydrogenase PdxA [Pluralibacter gergoviae]|mgnify:CR=1 FL=1|uniref:4-hydroxythreonine-4-phosphate dehydrogenase PdxA n=1 Tax=Pluralibacter gergoviae TaxID=61647 RepID=A0AAW8HL57_PLUGE|nr:4-hydroxythreonine-4-phosphate dehydrogenase PdxA [Pluralibacter gergoviae]AVR03297.1 4-hydroxythreonine-4-phosphate dehydrogenase PdxA [Pluralibacter gergoviae]EKV0928026.1 4-hydroxythreonine-4-phosphate dehydrogenase PdxA [Pluralibacter gergoviae]EKV6245962.1 4-hydroxythreonine-4-phosphate dehydrogenase PdxA [Pluralibacter gergoviae]EKW9966207.1 4-hydroxythreonine-4-phosphate dehydrogenase PdxA [Pluralibacter gergoviae]ELD4269288.1 4-hydroxythreonine-4-phosphate dehydrogenase PdxA [Plural